MNEKDLIYIVGFFDGEGSIYCSKGLDRKNQRITYANAISFGNTNKEIIFWLRKIIGFGFVRKRKFRPKWKAQYELVISADRDIRKFLNLVSPYLKIKRPQAEVLLSYLNNRLLKIRPGKSQLGSRNNPYGEETCLMHERLKILNRKGVASEIQNKESFDWRNLRENQQLSFFGG